MTSKKNIAIIGLMLATAVWGTSFVMFRTILLYTEKIIGDNESFFNTFSLFNVGLRFFLAALGLFFITMLINKKSLSKITKLEFRQSLLLALTGGPAVLLQMHALRITPASTSAFLTQAYCILIPWLSWWRRGSKINRKTFLATILVLISLKLITGFNFQVFHLGLGEGLTLLAAFLFSFQILCFEEEIFKNNRSLVTTVLMFFITGIILLLISAYPLYKISQGNQVLFNQFLAIQTNPKISLIIFAMILGPTIIAFWSMASFQPKISATHAGLIYCFEPIWASLFAVLFPLFLAPWLGIYYPPDFLSVDLIWGAILMLVAQVLIIVK